MKGLRCYVNRAGFMRIHDSRLRQSTYFNIPGVYFRCKQDKICHLLWVFYPFFVGIFSNVCTLHNLSLKIKKNLKIDKFNLTCQGALCRSAMLLL